MGDKFYKVKITDCYDDFFFHDYEDAAAFLLESFYDDFYDLDEGQLAEANEQLAETSQIEDYGAIYECYFEK